MSQLNRLRAGLVTLGLLATAPAAGGGHRVTPVVQDDDYRERLAAVLERAQVDAAYRADILAADLARLARPAERAVSVFLLPLAAGGVPGDWRDERRLLALDLDVLGALEAALADLPGDALRAQLGEMARTELRLAVRASGVRVVGRFGVARDLELLQSLATPLRPETAEPPLDVPAVGAALPRVLRCSYADALTAVLARDVGTFLQLGDAFDRLETGLRGSAVDAVATFETDLALETLVGFLGHTPGFDPHILAAIAHCARTVAHPVTERLRIEVRERLFALDPEVVRSAMRAAGALEDYGAVSALIEELESQDERTVTTALLALQDLTRLRFEAEPALWKRWYADEEEWRRRHRQGHEYDLERGDEAAAREAIQAIAGRRIDRHELALVLQRGLDRHENALVVLTCHGLAELGSNVAVRRLLGALEHHDGEVRTAAWQALQRITGLELPQDATLWRASV